jgi:PPP family 3-phenylpropionic acid transporter
MTLRLFLFMFLRGAAYGAIGPWGPLALLSSGVSVGLIGPVAGIGALITIAAAPAWGIAGDRRGRRKMLAAAFAVAAFAALGHAAGGRGVLIAAVMLWTAASAAFIPIGDSLTLSRLDNDRARYSRVRIGATIGYCIASVAVGFAALQIGWAAIAVVGTALCVAGSVALLSRLRNERRAKRVATATAGQHADAGLEWAAPEAAGAVAESAGDEGAAIALFSRVRDRWPFLAGLAIVFAGANAPTIFVGPKLVAIGGSPIEVGIASAASAIVEVPVFLILPLLLRRFGGRRLFVAGTALMTVSSLAAALAPLPVMVIGARLLFGAGYAAMIVPSLSALANSAKPGEGSAIQALHFGANAAGTLLVAVVGLPIAEGGGASAVIAGAALAAPLGAVLAARRWPTAASAAKPKPVVPTRRRAAA